MAQNNQERARILNILITLPRIRIRIASYISQAGRPTLWEKIKDLCEPLGLTDTAFRDHPNLKDYLVSYDYWERRLGIIKPLPRQRREW